VCGHGRSWLFPASGGCFRNRDGTSSVGLSPVDDLGVVARRLGGRHGEDRLGRDRKTGTGTGWGLVALLDLIVEGLLDAAVPELFVAVDASGVDAP
jgi:hypothetical protein